MAKKFVLVLVFMAIVAGGVFADWPATETWGGNKNFISGSASLFGVGVTYERVLIPRLSIGVAAYISSYFLLTEIAAPDVFVRYYFWNGLFGELGLGFHVQSIGLLGLASLDLLGFGITPGVGFKFDPGKAGGFFIEPGVKFPITIGKYNLKLGYYNSGYTPGVHAGFDAIPYVNLGWAF